MFIRISYEVRIYFISISFIIRVNFTLTVYELLMKFLWNIRHIFTWSSFEVQVPFIWTSYKIQMKSYQFHISFISRGEYFQKKFIWTDRHNISFGRYQPSIVQWHFMNQEKHGKVQNPNGTELNIFQNDMKLTSFIINLRNTVRTFQHL